MYTLDHKPTRPVGSNETITLPDTSTPTGTSSRGAW